MSDLKLNWKAIGQVEEEKKDIQVVIDKYSEVFEGGLGTLRGVTAKIHLDPQAIPRFYRLRPVPVYRVAKLDTYPLPKVNDLLATLAGMSSFT